MLNKSDQLLNEAFVSVAELEKNPKHSVKAKEGSTLVVEEFELFDHLLLVALYIIYGLKNTTKLIL